MCIRVNTRWLESEARRKVFISAAPATWTTRLRGTRVLVHSYCCTIQGSINILKYGPLYGIIQKAISDTAAAVCRYHTRNNQPVAVGLLEQARFILFARSKSYQGTVSKRYEGWVTRLDFFFPPDVDIMFGFGQRRPPPRPRTLTLTLTRGLLGCCASCGNIDAVVVAVRAHLGNFLARAEIYASPRSNTYVPGAICGSYQVYYTINRSEQTKSIFNVHTARYNVEQETCVPAETLVELDVDG